MATRKTQSHRGSLFARNQAEGAEPLDLTPMALPVGAKRPEGLHAEMRRFIRTELAAKLEAAQGEQMETFEEANDFEEDDPDLWLPTAYEVPMMDVDDTPPIDMPVEASEAPQEADLPVTGTSPLNARVKPVSDESEPLEADSEGFLPEGSPGG